MTISDLLTLIGILLAIFAFISEKNREYVFLKFSYLEVLILVCVFFFLHFLISFEWWREKLNFLSYFIKEGYPIPSAWAYIISLTTLIWAVWKIFKGNFPLSNKERLMKYYEKLLMRNETAFLSELIEQYHLESVKNYLKAKKTIVVSNESSNWRTNHKNYNTAYKKAINNASTIYGNNVYFRIILNNHFIDNVANHNPYLFASVIQELNTKDVKDDDFVNRFLKIITQQKNGFFFKEIRENLNLTNHDAYDIGDSRPILHSLFSDINVASINQAWRGIAEQALLEMAEESKKEFSTLRESDGEQEHDTIWSFRITIAIWYFDIMVRAAISQNINDHMWMYYYKHFVVAILKNMEKLPTPESDFNRYTRNFDLIEEILIKMMKWKDVAIKSKHYQFANCIYDCMGQCIYELCISDKLSDNDKHHILNWVWENLIKTYPNENNETAINAVDQIIERGFEMFRKPTMLFAPSYRVEEGKAYLKSLRQLWDKRDTPILDGGLGRRADKFKMEVIDVLFQQ